MNNNLLLEQAIRNNPVIIIKKEKAENYANYWEQENNESSQTIEELVNGTKRIEDILNKIFKG